MTQKVCTQCGCDLLGFGHGIFVRVALLTLEQSDLPKGHRLVTADWPPTHVSSELYFANFIFTFDIFMIYSGGYTLIGTDMGPPPDVRFCPAACARDHRNSIALTAIQHLAHWGRVTHLCIRELGQTKSDNGLSLKCSINALLYVMTRRLFYSSP